MAFVRKEFNSDPRRNGSILKQLLKRYGADDVEIMVRGAALLGWKDLRGLYSKEGIGRRWAQTAYWNREKKIETKIPESIRSIFAKWGGQ